MSLLQEALDNGVFTIEQVASALRMYGYIMEGRDDVGSRCTRTLISSIASDFLPLCRAQKIPVDDDIDLQATATDEGDVYGGHRYIVFNSNRYSFDQARELLVIVNTAEKKIRDLQEATL